MIRVCAWCKKVLGHIEPYEDHSSSHGLCLSCKEEYFPALDKEMETIKKGEKND